MNTEPLPSVDEEKFVRDKGKFQACRRAKSNAFRRLIITANVISTINIAVYFFGIQGDLNIFWRTELFIVHLIKVFAEVLYNRFGLDLFVHHLCMLFFYLFIPEDFLWLGPQGCLVHIPLVFQSSYFLYREHPNLWKISSGLFWTLWLPVIAHRITVALLLGVYHIVHGMEFGTHLIAIGMLGVTLDVFWSREFVDAQLSIHPHHSTWAKSVSSLYKSPVCILLIMFGIYTGYSVGWRQAYIPRMSFVVVAATILWAINWKNIMSAGKQDQQMLNKFVKSKVAQVAPM